MNILIFSSHAEPNYSAMQLMNWEMWNHQHAFSRNAGPYKIATKMRELGHAVEVADFIVYWPDEKIKQFLDERVLLLDIMAWSSQFFFNFNFYEKWYSYIKKLNPNITFIVGGPKVTNLLNFKHSRYFIAGYAEDAIEDVLNHIAKKPNKLKFKLVNGSYYVDCLEYYPMKNLPDLQTVYHPSDCIIPSETLTLSTSRGCIFKCSFCTYPYIGKRKGTFDRDGAQVYYNELMYNYQQWGTTNYFVSDETVNDSIDKLKDLEEAALQLPFKLCLTGFARLDLMSRQKEYWQLFKNIGLLHWHFGIESFNPKSLAAMSKGFSPVKLKQTLYEIKDFFKDDATVYASFIIGAPYDTPDTFEELTVDWLRNQGKELLDGKTIFPLNIHRETEFAVGSELSRNFTKYGYREMTDEEIRKEVRKDTNINEESIRETQKYNILWTTDHWNVFDVERLSAKYLAEVVTPTNLGPWTRAKIASVGISADEIKQLRNPNNHPLFREFEKRLPTVLNNYINNKIKTNWFLTN